MNLRGTDGAARRRLAELLLQPAALANSGWEALLAAMMLTEGREESSRVCLRARSAPAAAAASLAHLASLAKDDAATSITTVIVDVSDSKIADVQARTLRV